MVGSGPLAKSSPPSARLIARKIIRGKVSGQRAQCSLLARFVSDHLAPAPDGVSCWGHWDADRTARTVLTMLSRVVFSAAAAAGEISRPWSGQSE